MEFAQTSAILAKRDMITAIMDINAWSHSHRLKLNAASINDKHLVRQSVRPSVCLSYAGILSERLNIIHMLKVFLTVG